MTKLQERLEEVEDNLTPLEKESELELLEILRINEEVLNSILERLSDEDFEQFLDDIYCCARGLDLVDWIE